MFYIIYSPNGKYRTVVALAITIHHTLSYQHTHATPAHAKALISWINEYTEVRVCGGRCNTTSKV